MVSAVVLGLAGTARAQDEFEIQVYDVETARRGDPGLEVHLNEHLFPAAPDETHLTLEPHYGLRDWLELGGYFQTSLSTTGDLEYAGVKLRTKLRWPDRLWDGRLGLAINFELSNVPARFEPNVWGSEVRSIVDFKERWFYAAVNPIVSTDLAGKLAGHPQLEPAVKLGVQVARRVMLGAEGYAGFGPVDALGSENVLRAFAVADVRGAWWDLNVGVGINHGIADHPIGKLIFGIHPAQ
ncbi:MAG TPA: hypothetical protein VLX92_12800 [Kofleriaceae bacterium]|nr:hypothetical protein [Kofleriaceae bacterium]